MLLTPVGLMCSLLFFCFIGGVEFTVFVYFQGNAYITCMPGPVRRWNYPVPLCLGNGLFCIFFLAYRV